MEAIEKDAAPKLTGIDLEHRYRDLFERTSDLIMVHDLEGRLLDVNPAVTRLSGYRPEELIGRSIEAFVTPEFRPLFREAYLSEIGTQGYAEGVVRLLAKDGREHFIEYANVLVHQEGRSPYVSGLGRDITERLQAKQALQRAQEETEQRIVMRTTELVEANVLLKRETVDRKKVEAQLRTSQERYALATRAAGVGVWDLNLETNEFYLDPNVKEILGYRDDEIPNDIEVWSSYVHPKDKQAVMEAFQAHIEGKQPEFVYEHRMLRKDGATCWIMARGSAMRDSHGNPIRVVGTDTDITARKHSEEALHKILEELEDRVRKRTADLSTINAQLELEISERKKTEKALRENEERYRALADASFEAVFISENGICIDTNNTAVEMFGYDHEELIGIFGTDVIAPESRDLVMQNMLSGYEKPYEAIAQRKDGTTFQVEIRGKMTELKGRRVRITVVHDIDQNKKMEARLRKSEKKYRQIFDLSPEAIVLLDTTETIIDVNAMFLDWLGYRREEVVGKRIQDLPFLSGSHKSKAMRNFWRRMAGEKISPYELDFYTKGGEKRVGRIVATPIKAENGESVQDLGMIADITERIQAEQALQQREAELEVRSRDLEEVNAALKVLLKKRERDKSVLEERVLLNVKNLIVPYLQKLKKTGANNLQKSYIKILETHLGEIVSSFYQTLSASYADLTPKEIQVADLVRQGHTTKEIATLLNSSPRAVEFHRNNIRKKFGLTNHKTNLRSHLLNLH